VLLQKPRCFAEIYNDLDGEISNLFEVVRDHGYELVRLLELTPFSRKEFDLSYQRGSDPIECARRTVVRAYMGFGSTVTRATRKDVPMRTGFRSNSNRSGSSPAADWRNLPYNVPAIIERLRGVVIENRDAAEVMVRHDSETTLHYVDPPYVHSTRTQDTGGHRRGYRYELTDADHGHLASVLHGLSGAVVLSGYGCDLYDRELYPDWHRVERTARADGAKERTEVLWLNPPAAAAAASELFRREELSRV
jgi:DNA adenine methylase